MTAPARAVESAGGRTVSLGRRYRQDRARRSPACRGRKKILGRRPPCNCSCSFIWHVWNNAIKVESKIYHCPGHITLLEIFFTFWLFFQLNPDSRKTFTIAPLMAIMANGHLVLIMQKGSKLSNRSGTEELLAVFYQGYQVAADARSKSSLLLSPPLD